MPLTRYYDKNSLIKTSKTANSQEIIPENVFVIQKHFALHFHYDFRIRVGEVLKSWAMPKEPSDDTHIKRLMIESEDHPLEYANFEGEIPKGQSGAGRVEIWDRGDFTNATHNCSLQDGLKNGHIVVDLNGTKMKGKYAITFFKDNKWLFVKHK